MEVNGGKYLSRIHLHRLACSIPLVILPCDRTLLGLPVHKVLQGQLTLEQGTFRESSGAREHVRPRPELLRLPAPDIVSVLASPAWCCEPGPSQALHLFVLAQRPLASARGAECTAGAVVGELVLQFFERRLAPHTESSAACLALGTTRIEREGKATNDEKTGDS